MSLILKNRSEIVMINQDKLFYEIKNLIIEWVQKNQKYFKDNNIEMNILRNETDGLVVGFENSSFMAEIVVENSNFAPYRFISFEVAAIIENQTAIIYSWYDNDNTSKQEIEDNLKKGIDYFINNDEK